MSETRSEGSRSLGLRCRDCQAPCTVTETSENGPRAFAQCTKCGVSFELLPDHVEKKPKRQWSIVNPEGEEVSFHSREELRQAVFDDELEPQVDSIPSMGLQAGAPTSASKQITVPDLPALGDMDDDTVELPRAPRSER